MRRSVHGRLDRGVEWLFVTRLQEVMLKRNLSIAQVAEKTHIPTRTMQGWITERHCPRLGDPRRKQVAKALRVPLAWMNGLDQEASDVDDRNDDQGQADN